MGVDPSARASPQHDAVRRLLVVPRTPFLLVCGDVLAKWSNWDKPGVSARGWSIELRSLIVAHLRDLCRRSEKLDTLEEIRVQTQGGGAAPPCDRYCFGRKGSFGSAEIVDFALLDDAHDMSLGTLVVLVLYTPENEGQREASAAGGCLWLYTLDIDLQDSTQRAAPQVRDCIFISAGVATASNAPGGQESFVPAPPKVYTLLPSWRLYLSWTDRRDGLVVLGQIDVRSVPALAEALRDSLPEHVVAGDADVAACLVSPPGIVTLPTELHCSEVVAINTSAGRAASEGPDRSQLDGLVLLLDTQRGGKLLQCCPQMGTNTLRWGDRTLMPRNDSVQGLLLDEGVFVGAIRDALSLTRLDDLVKPVSDASLSVVDRRDIFPRCLSARRKAHESLIERLHGAGLTVARGSESIVAAVRAGHEAVCAAECAWECYQDLLAASRDGGSSGEFVRAAAAAGLDLLHAAMDAHTRPRFSEQDSQAHSSAELFFSRPSQLVEGLAALSQALRSELRELHTHQRAFLASHCLATLLGAALQGAKQGADFVDAAQERDATGSSFARALRDVTIDCLECLRDASASSAQTTEWADARRGEASEGGAGAAEPGESCGAALVDFCRLVLLDYDADAQTSRDAASPLGDTSHMALEFQKRQHVAKKCVADVLMNLGLFDSCFLLSERFLVLEGVMRSAHEFFPFPCRHSHAGMMAHLRALLAGKGAARALAVLSEPQHAAMANEGTYTVAEYVFLWIETHRPDLCALLLTLRDECRDIFDDYITRVDGPLVRKSYAWLAAARDGDLAKVAERALATAVDGNCDDLEARTAMAAVAKLAAYACQLDLHGDAGSAEGPRSSLMQLAKQDLAGVQGAADCILVSAEMQRRFFQSTPRALSEATMVDALLQAQPCSISHCSADRLLCVDCRAHLLEHAQASLLLMQAALSSPSPSPDAASEMLDRVVRVWRAASLRDGTLWELDTLLSSHTAVTEAEQSSLWESSLLCALLATAPAELKPTGMGQATWVDVLQPQGGQQGLSARTVRAVEGWASQADRGDDSPN